MWNPNWSWGWWRTDETAPADETTQAETETDGGDDPAE